MNKPIYEIFAKGVQVTVWSNENTEKGTKFLSIKVKERYTDKQGLKHDREFFNMDSIPLLISALNRMYADFSTMITTDDRNINKN